MCAKHVSALCSCRAIQYTESRLALLGSTGPDRCPRAFREAKAKLTLYVTKVLVHALAQVHGAGCAHRDIKPENLLLCLEDGAWVMKVRNAYRR